MDFRSNNFLIHTDLVKEDAEALLQKMETMLKLISRYWGAENRRTIKCYVVDDLKHWPRNSIPAEGANAVQFGGLTVARGGVRSGRSQVNAIVYASSRYGTPLHEAVHAYCYQTFGLTGPTWYAEGMAEMGNYWVEGDPTVTAPDYVLRYLKQSERKSLDEITDNRDRTGDGWKNYAWRWALCHFLANNSNYYDRFRSMGAGFLTRQPSSFSRSYSSQMQELDFEFQFFIEHLERGFDVGRTAWDWKAAYRKHKGGSPITSAVSADRGWQPSGLEVESGQMYSFAAKGIWHTTEDSSGVSATGGVNGSGRLVGVLLADYELGAEFELGRTGTFTAKRDGVLLLRCRDKWNQLNDNKGSVSISIATAAD